MKIAVNAVLAYEQPRGIGNYLNIILPALADIDKTNEYYIYYGRWMRNYIFTGIKQDNFHLIELDMNNSQVGRNLFLSVRLPLMVRRLKADIYWLPDSRATLIKPCRVVSTIHDLAEYVVPEKYSPIVAFVRRTYLKRQVAISDHIITVSDYSGKDLCSRFGLSGDMITVIPLALNKRTYRIQHPDAVQDYFLFVGEIERAKNLNVLIRAYIQLDKEIRDRFELRIVGKKGNNYEEILSMVRDAGIEDRVRFCGYLSDEELDEMYLHAYAFVFPSLFEGFGFPVLEAMTRGVPVICSDSSSIPEVGGDAVLTFEPNDDRALAGHLSELIMNKEHRNRLAAQGIDRSRHFNTDTLARNTLEVLDRTGTESSG
ncbi:MAG: glycosyltransferase family 4 protein [Lachnospiraceae bacterium]|nr:glycosyltransferase family 4 protein [Lachnospiraceae bacterium]